MVFGCRDLATRNCLLTSNLTLKVGDYGLSENKYPEDYYQGTLRVPVRWCSPESLTCTPTTIQPKKTTTESNIWSLGVTIWEICECGEQPYSALSDDEVVSQVFGSPNIRLLRPTFSILYTDYLYRLMQLCWTNAESRPIVSQIDLMLTDLWQVYKNTKTSTLTADDFDKRWELCKPNSLVKNYRVDNAEIEECGTNIKKPLSPSLNNLHGSLDNLLDSSDQMELWLEKITKSDDLSLAKSNSIAILSLDGPLVLEISSSDSSDRASPKQKKLKMKSKIDFDLNTKFRDKQPYNFSDSALFSQRTSSESETEDENWRNKVERGAYTEKVRLKSRSVADLMILTHVDYSESESETPLPSLDYRVNYKNVRYAPKNNLENISLTYGSEGNLLSVHDTFQEELKKLKEERRDSLLFVPDNYSQTSFNKLDNNNHNFPVEELTLSDSNLNNIGAIDSTSKRLMHELNRVAEIQPANQVFNVFSVTIDKFKPFHVNNCKLNDIINFNDFESEQNDKAELTYEEHREVVEAPVEKPLLHEYDNKKDRQKTNSCDTSKKHISDVIPKTYPPALTDINLQNQPNEVDLYQLSNNNISNGYEIYHTGIQLDNEKCAIYLDVNNFVCDSKEANYPSSSENGENNEAEISSSNTGSNTETSTPGTVIHCNIFLDNIKHDWNVTDLHNLNEKMDNNLQIAAPSERQINLEINQKVSGSKLPQIDQYENLDVIVNENISELLVEHSEMITETSKDFGELPSISNNISNKNCIDCNITPNITDLNKDLCNKFQELEAAQNKILSGGNTPNANDMICNNENGNFTFETKSCSEVNIKKKVLNDVKSLSEVLIAKENKKLLWEPHNTVQVSKVSEIVKSKIAIPPINRNCAHQVNSYEISIPEVIDSKCHVNTEFQKSLYNDIGSKNLYAGENFKNSYVHMTLNQNSERNQTFQNEDITDLNGIILVANEDPKVDYNFEILKGKDESLCEAKNIVLVPKLSEIGRNKIFNESSYPEMHKYLSDPKHSKLEINTQFHTLPRTIETADFNGSDNIDKTNVESNKDSKDEPQGTVQNESIIDMRDIVVNEVPITEKELYVPKGYELKSNIQVLKLMDIIKERFVVDENLSDTYQFNLYGRLLAERNCLASKSSAKDPKTVNSTKKSNNELYKKIQNKNEVSVDKIPEMENSFRISKNYLEPSWTNINAVENFYDEVSKKFEYKNSVYVDHFEVCGASSEEKNNFHLLKNESDDSQINAADKTENLNYELLEKKHKNLNGVVLIGVNEVPKENNFQVAKENKVVTTVNSCQNSICEVVNLSEIILIDVNKTAKEEVSTKTELNHNQISPVNSTNNSNGELYKQIEHKNVTDLNVTDLNEIVNTGINEAPDKENNLQLTEQNGVDIANSVQNSCVEVHNTKNEEVVDLNEIVLTDLEETSEVINNFQVQKLFNFILNKQNIYGPELNCLNQSDVDVKSESVFNADDTLTVPNLAEDNLNKNISPKSDGNHNSNGELIFSVENNFTEQDESHAIGDKKYVLEFEKICKIKDGKHIDNDNNYLEDKIISTTFDLSGNQEQVVPNMLSVFTSTPRNIKNYIFLKETHSNLNLFDVTMEKDDSKNVNFCSDFVPLGTRKELNYSLETWDNFLGKTLDAQKNIQNENLFDSFSSEPHSLLFVESGNDLVQPHECAQVKNVCEDNHIVISNENNPNNISNTNSGTFIIEAKNENTFVIGDNELTDKNVTFTLNKTKPLECDTEGIY